MEGTKVPDTLEMLSRVRQEINPRPIHSIPKLRASLSLKNPVFLPKKKKLKSKPIAGSHESVRFAYSVKNLLKSVLN